MLDAWIIEELKKRKEQKEERDRPSLQFPIPQYFPIPKEKREEEDLPYRRIEISYEQEEPRNPFEVNFEVDYFKM